MPEIITRAGKGSELTHNELDANFSREVVTATTTFTVLTSHNRNTIEGNHASTPFTATLPTVAAAAGVDTGDFIVNFTNINAAVMSIDANGTETINGSTDTIDLAQWESVTIELNNADSGWVKKAPNIAIEALKLVYPVGTIYTNKTDSTSPATLFGFGTWVAIEDSFLIGASGTYAAESTGGSKDAIVVAHTHTIPIYGDSSAGSVTARAGTGGLNGNEVTSSTGSSGTDANLPPYVAVYMWERTA